MKVKILLIILIFSSIVFAQIPEIKISHVSYGSNPSDVYLTISNPGRVPDPNVKILVDGKLFRTVSEGIDAKNAIKVHLILPSGDHTITVESSNGASDSIDIVIGEALTLTEEPNKTGWKPGKRDIIGIAAIILVFIAGIAVESYNMNVQ
ncbi:MAG: hypothetical protein J7L43_02885 [Candidatus Aenigmarchaeota archaeon]|nr:hypothetical protein [Candidatus Aenigmarchaeota archaeon]